MFATYRRLLPLAPMLIAVAACNKFQTATDVTTSRMNETRDVSGPAFTYMGDNAILRDMSVTDIHFIPHTTELSGVGVARLNRMASLLDTYGGTVRYDTLEEDEAIVGQRLAHVHEYLELTGCDMGRVKLAAMLPGGRGIPGDEAIRKYLKGTTADEGTETGATFVPGVLSQSAGQ